MRQTSPSISTCIPFLNWFVLTTSAIGARVADGATVPSVRSPCHARAILAMRRSRPKPGRAARPRTSSADRCFQTRGALRVRREELKGLAVALGALAHDALRREVGDHRIAPPVLPLVDVGEVNLDDGHLQDLDSVADRKAVVGPGGGVEDDTLGDLGHLVEPVDVAPFAVRLAAADVEVELVAPGVDLRFELPQGKATVDLWVTPAEDIQVHPVQHLYSHEI